MRTLDPTLTGHLKGDTLGRRMLASRTRAGLTQKSAAESIGLSAGQLGRIERGSVGMVSDANTLVRAARAYGVSEIWLYAGPAGGFKFVPEWYEAPTAELAT